MTDIRTDVLDLQAAWEIQQRGGLKHHPRCASVPGWHPLCGPEQLCDCGAVPSPWRQVDERSRIGAALAPRPAPARTQDADLPAVGSFHG